MMTNPTIDIYGSFLAEEKPSTEYLTIVFSPSSLPLKERWRTHRLSASFLADYFSTFAPSLQTNNLVDPESEIISSITFIANELLENAMKFSQDIKEGSITISIRLYPNKLIFETENQVFEAQADKFKQFITEVQESDPSALYFQRIEQSALDETGDESGLGILTIINDYAGQFAWKFEALNDHHISVTSKVAIAI